MKRILLFIGIVTFSFASAQPHSSFDAKKYLLKRLELYKSLYIDDLIHRRFYSSCGQRSLDYIFAIKKKFELELPGSQKISRIIAEVKWNNQIYPPRRIMFSNPGRLNNKKQLQQFMLAKN